MEVLQTLLPHILEPSAEFQLYNSADDTQVEIGVFGLVHKVSAVEILVGQLTDTDSHKLAINPMVKMVGAHMGRVSDLLLFKDLLQSFAFI